MNVMSTVPNWCESINDSAAIAQIVVEISCKIYSIINSCIVMYYFIGTKVLMENHRIIEVGRVFCVTKFKTECFSINILCMLAASPLEV
jgi:hypothetical protein